MKCERYYCPACEIVVKYDEYMEHESHMCSNCRHECLVPIVITDEGDLLEEALDVCRELLRVDDEWHGAVNSEMADARNAVRALLAKVEGK